MLQLRALLLLLAEAAVVRAFWAVVAAKGAVRSGLRALKAALWTSLVEELRAWRQFPALFGPGGPDAVDSLQRGRICRLVARIVCLTSLSVWVYAHWGTGPGGLGYLLLQLFAALGGAGGAGVEQGPQSADATVETPAVPAAQSDTARAWESIGNRIASVERSKMAIEVAFPREAATYNIHMADAGTAARGLNPVRALYQTHFNVGAGLVLRPRSSAQVAAERHLVYINQWRIKPSLIAFSEDAARIQATEAARRARRALWGWQVRNAYYSADTNFAYRRGVWQGSLRRPKHLRALSAQQVLLHARLRAWYDRAIYQHTRYVQDHLRPLQEHFRLRVLGDARQLGMAHTALAAQASRRFQRAYGQLFPRQPLLYAATQEATWVRVYAAIGQEYFKATGALISARLTGLHMRSMRRLAQSVLRANVVYGNTSIGPHYVLQKNYTLLMQHTPRRTEWWRGWVAQRTPFLRQLAQRDEWLDNQYIIRRGAPAEQQYAALSQARPLLRRAIQAKTIQRQQQLAQLDGILNYLFRAGRRPPFNMAGVPVPTQFSMSGWLREYIRVHRMGRAINTAARAYTQIDYIVGDPSIF